MTRSSLFLGAAAACLLAVGAASAQGFLTLDEITVLAKKTQERAIDALAAISNVTSEQLDRTKPSRLQDVFASTPGVVVDGYSDDPGVGFNVRGLEDYGRVAVVVDGARQNFQIAEHGPEGQVYLDPELISSAEVARGPVANIYGSGAIGGVVSLSTKDVDDVLAPDERYGALFDGTVGSNGGPLMGSVFLAARANESADFIVGTVQRHLSDYKDGNGDVVANSGSDTTALLGKANFHISPGQDLKLGEVYQHVTFDSGTPGDGTYSNAVDNSTLTLKYSLAPPENPLIDLEASGYWNHGEATSTVTEEQCLYLGPPPCVDFSGPVGTTTGYRLDTLGYDVHNSSRFHGLGLDNTITVGTDLFADTVDSTGSNPAPDAGYRLTASGDRQAYGAFAQWDARYQQWLELIGALRFDGYHMTSDGYQGKGNRISPKVTVGVTPFTGFTVYGTYAEGYRAPSLNEAFAVGDHPGELFQYLPNPELMPETGHTLEAGVNISRDGIFRTGDSFRVKADVFNNQVTDYINGVAIGDPTQCSFVGVFGPLCYQYQNIAAARIRGFEAQAAYDTGTWFAEVSGTVQQGVDTTTGERLGSVLPAQAAITLGARFLDKKLTVAPTWRYVAGNTFLDSEGDTITYSPFNLFGLSIAYQPNANTTASLVFDNLFNAEYTPYLSNNPGQGFNVKASLKVKLAAK